MSAGHILTELKLLTGLMLQNVTLNRVLLSLAGE